MHRNHRKTINQFKENVELINKINYRNAHIRDSTYGIALMLSNMYFAKDDPMRKKIQGDYMIKVDCVSEYGQERYDAGKIEMIKKLLNREKITINDAINELKLLDCDLECISKVTKLSESEIKKIINQE